ncbi:hypothetical protein ASF72_11870 [Arthrobacter sp. Leaf141]|uniref:O-antigen ligase family protein n=1 Tax=Micrococcaceae TaxID=1268 RepID=UPI0006F34095|nr:MULTISPECIES: O-antigen ligase family protein [Micrococcaceae]KQR02302.1 hypothetical protein ASF72_11870 [Arthrobacter sp. Leaf141]
MQLGLWIGLCFATAFLLRSRPRILVGSVLALWFLVPAVGSQVVTGVPSGPLSLHAASWLILAVFLARLLDAPAAFGQVLGRHFVLFLALAVVVAAAVLASRAADSGGGMVLLADQIVAPVLFFFLLLTLSITDAGLAVWLRNLLLWLVAAVCAVALLQWLTHSPLVYEQGFSKQYWYKPENNRWMGTLDQPLALSLVIVAVAPLVAGLKRNLVQLVLLVLMIVGILITQSRAGLVVLAACVAVVVLFARRPAWLKGILLALIAAAAILITTSPLIEGVVGRIEDDTGSTEARALSLQYFFNHWGDYAIAGQGSGASYRVAVQGGLETSFENPLLMYSVDFGIAFAVLYFGTMVALLLRHGLHHRVRGLTLAAILVIAVPQTYSSLATRSVAGILVWTVLAMLVMAAEAARRERQEAARTARHPEEPAGTRTAAAP